MSIKSASATSVRRRRSQSVRLRRIRSASAASASSQSATTKSAISKPMSMSQSRLATSPLARRMLQDMQLAGFGERTQEAYRRAVWPATGGAQFTRTSPDRITEEQLRRYFLSLRNEKQFAPGSLKIAYSGIRFFYTHTVKRDWQTLRQLRVPKQRKLPAVLSLSEVRQLLAAVTTPHNRAFLITTYSLGLRLQEELFLQVGDIDGRSAGGGLVHVHRGKGAKDRDQSSVGARRCRRRPSMCCGSIGPRIGIRHGCFRPRVAITSRRPQHRGR